MNYTNKGIPTPTRQKKKPSQEITKDAVLLSPSAFHAMQWTKTFCLRTLAPQVPSTPCGSNSNMHLGGSVRQQRSLYCSYGNKTRDQLRYSSARQCYVLFYVWTPRKLGRYEREIIAIPLLPTRFDDHDDEEGGNSYDWNSPLPPCEQRHENLHITQRIRRSFPFVLCHSSKQFEGLLKMRLHASLMSKTRANINTHTQLQGEGTGVSKQVDT